MRATNVSRLMIGWLAYAVVAVALAAFLVALVRDGRPSIWSVVLASAGLALLAADAFGRRRAGRAGKTRHLLARGAGAALAVSGLGAAELLIGQLTDRERLVVNGAAAIAGGAIVALGFLVVSRRPSI